MEPFDLPPSTPPVSLDPPAPARSHRRWRTPLVALTSAGMVAGGLVVAGRFASADRPALDGTAALSAPDPTPAPTVPDPAVPADDSTSDDTSGDDTGTGESEEHGSSVDGEVVIDLGDGDPITIDLGDLDEETMQRLAECVGGPLFQGGWLEDGWLDMGEFGEEFDFSDPRFDVGDGFPGGDTAFPGLPTIGDGDATVTVFGADGVSIVDLGEGDGSVTISRTDGEISIETTGDATVSDLDQVFDEAIPAPALPPAGSLDLPDPDQLRACIEDLQAQD